MSDERKRKQHHVTSNSGGPAKRPETGRSGYSAMTKGMNMNQKEMMAQLETLSM